MIFDLIFCLFQIGFLQATQAVKVKFEIEQRIKFKNQVQINRGFGTFDHIAEPQPPEGDKCFMKIFNK